MNSEQAERVVWAVVGVAVIVFCACLSVGLITVTYLLVMGEIR